MIRRCQVMQVSDFFARQLRHDLTPQDALRQLADGCGWAHVGLTGALRVVTQNCCWVLTATRRDHMERNAGVEQERLVSATQIVQPEIREPELGKAADDLLR